MPMPWTYRHASREFRAFLDDAKERMGLESDNMAYTAVDGVFRTFRRRLTPEQGILFASALPSVLSAIFIRDWDVTAPPLPFGTRAEMTREAQALRRHHNLTPDNAIEATAFALWRVMNSADLARVLDKLPPEARAFWAVEAPPEELNRGII